MPVVPSQKRTAARPVQGRLFASHVATERYWLDERSSTLMRTVELRGENAGSCTTVIAPWRGPGVPDDLRAAADLAYLQRTDRPDWTTGAPIRVADLFCGCGALSLGVAEACRAVGRAFVPVGGYDTNRRACETYSRNFGPGTGRQTDLSAVLAANLDAPMSAAESALCEEVGRVDVVVAGPPCQGHSNLNNRTRREDPKNGLYFLLARFAQLARPRLIIVENVLAVRQDRGNVVGRTIEALDSLGYTTDEDFVDLWSLGVPQSRRRHILVAQLSDELKRSARPPFVTDMLAPYVTRSRTVGWALDDLLGVSHDTPLDQLKQADPVTQARIDYLFDNNVYDLPKSHRPESHKGQHGDSYKSVYGRMRWDEPSPTITGGFQTMGQGRFVHPRRRRTLTAHEAMRLQCIPDFFDLSPALESRIAIGEIVGNAVPPKLGYALALEFLR